MVTAIDVDKLLNELHRIATSNTPTSEDIVVKAVRNYWKQQGYNMKVVVFLAQKYYFEDVWDRTSCIIDPNSDYEDPMEVFIEIDWDFCEGQQNVKDIKIVPLDEVIDFYAEEKL